MARSITDAERKKRYASLNLTSAQEDELCEYDKVCEKSNPSPSSKDYIPTAYDLTEQQRKTAQTMTHTGTRTAYKFTKREHKKNTTKAAIVAEIAQFLTENGNISAKNVEILNGDRLVGFSIGDDRFEVTLTQKRKPK